MKRNAVIRDDVLHQKRYYILDITNKTSLEKAKTCSENTRVNTASNLLWDKKEQLSTLITS